MCAEPWSAACSVLLWQRFGCKECMRRETISYSAFLVATCTFSRPARRGAGTQVLYIMFLTVPHMNECQANDEDDVTGSSVRTKTKPSKRSAVITDSQTSQDAGDIGAGPKRSRKVHMAECDGFLQHFISSFYHSPLLVAPPLSLHMRIECTECMFVWPCIVQHSTAHISNE